ncbi:MAG: DNA adenine methylase [Eubacteriales bacterium]
MKNIDSKPFLKWAGGKRQLLNTFNSLYPGNLLNGKIKKYVEPFLGGGAVFFELQRKYSFDEVVLNDINEELILTYKVVQKQCDSLIKKLHLLEDNFIPLNDEDRSKMYYSIREKFNEEKKVINYKDFEDTWIRHAAKLIFLNKTCFNGLYRVNKSGEFNVPFGKYKNPTICNKTNLKNVSQSLKGVMLISGEYYDVEKYLNIDSSTFIYIDPPYRPLTSSSSFTSYSKSGFNDDNQIKLANWYKRLVKVKNAQVMLSNSDPDDDFFHTIYEKNERDIFIKKVNAQRAINSKGTKRGKVSEIVVLNK